MQFRKVTSWSARNFHVIGLNKAPKGFCLEWNPGLATYIFIKTNRLGHYHCP
jgi:hypothetical protein